MTHNTLVSTLERRMPADTAAVQLRDRLRAIGRWASSRAWSRAGAVAHVVAVGAPRRVLARTSRLALFAFGSLTIAVSVAVMLWNQLGPGPLDVFIGAVRNQTGLPLTLAVWATVGSLLTVAWALGRRPGVGSIVGPLIVGPFMQIALERLQHFDVPSFYPARIAVQVLAIAGVGIGAGALVVSGLGAGSGELLAAAASDRSGHSQPRVRFVFEATWAVFGVALGGPLGVGTVLAAALLGPSVAAGHRTVVRLVVASRRQLDLLAGPVTNPVPVVEAVVEPVAA